MCGVQHLWVPFLDHCAAVAATGLWLNVVLKCDLQFSLVTITALLAYVL